MADSQNRDTQSEAKWDALLGKYVSVWIWSILIGVTISVAISFVGVRSGAVRGLFGAALAIPIILGVAAAYGGLIHLLDYLRGHIIPTFLVHDPERTDEQAAVHLYLALRYLVYAITLRLLTAAIEVALNAFAF